METRGGVVRVVVQEEGGLPHFTGHEEVRVLVLDPATRGRADDPVLAYTDAAEGDESGDGWSVQRDWDLDLDAGPLALAPAAESLALAGPLRGDVREAHLLYWCVRVYGLVRDAVGVPPAADGVRYDPFGPAVRETVLASYAEVCSAVGAVFGPAAAAAQRAAFGVAAG